MPSIVPGTQELLSGSRHYGSDIIGHHLAWKGSPGHSECPQYFVQRQESSQSIHARVLSTQSPRGWEGAVCVQVFSSLYNVNFKVRSVHGALKETKTSDLPGDPSG